MTIQCNSNLNPSLYVGVASCWSTDVKEPKYIQDKSGSRITYNQFIIVLQVLDKCTIENKSNSKLTGYQYG